MKKLLYMFVLMGTTMNMLGMERETRKRSVERSASPFTVATATLATLPEKYAPSETLAMSQSLMYSAKEYTEKGERDKAHTLRFGAINNLLKIPERDDATAEEKAMARLLLGKLYTDNNDPIKAILHLRSLKAECEESQENPLEGETAQYYVASLGSLYSLYLENGEHNIDLLEKIANQEVDPEGQEWAQEELEHIRKEKGKEAE